LRPLSGTTPGEEGRNLSFKQLIAVIDDDDPFRTALIESLESLGYDARGYASADEFVAADGQSSCDCIVTDIHMPGMGGIDLKVMLSARGSTVPVIMITARSAPGLEARALASGAVCLLKKPFDSAELIHCLELALNH
jgi:FixJ family two-component response regulator